LNCWTWDYWLFGGKVEYATPLAHLQDLPQLNWRHLKLSHHHYQCQEKGAISLDCRNLCLLLGWLILQQHTHPPKHNQVVTGNEKISFFKTESGTQPEL